MSSKKFTPTIWICGCALRARNHLVPRLSCPSTIGLSSASATMPPRAAPLSGRKEFHQERCSEFWASTSSGEEFRPLNSRRRCDGRPCPEVIE